MTPASYAVRYAERGLRVLPIRERSKEPLVAHGVHDASCDPAIVRAWWAQWPAANVAIAVPLDWFVLDVDPRNGGDRELARLEAAHGPLPPTVMAVTGSGGTHALFARSPTLKLRGKVAHGIDLLGVGRYFLVAPSIHPCGGTYRWTSAPGTAIAQPSAWLVDRARAPDPAPAPMPRGPVPDSSSRVDRARAYLAACPPATSGSGGHAHTFSIAQKLTRGFGLDETTAFALMVTWNRTCQPPWSAPALARKVREAARVGRMPVGALLEQSSERRGA